MAAAAARRGNSSSSLSAQATNASKTSSGTTVVWSSASSAAAVSTFVFMYATVRRNRTELANSWQKAPSQPLGAALAQVDYRRAYDGGRGQILACQRASTHLWRPFVVPSG